MAEEFENVWGHAVDIDKRGRHRTTASAIEAALKDLMTVHDPFFDSLADSWDRLFPGEPIRPGHYDDGVIYLYVPSATVNFMLRPKLPRFRAALAKLPGAPKRITLRILVKPEAFRPAGGAR